MYGCSYEDRAADSMSHGRRSRGLWVIVTWVYYVSTRNHFHFIIHPLALSTSDFPSSRSWTPWKCNAALCSVSFFEESFWAVLRCYAICRFSIKIILSKRKFHYQELGFDYFFACPQPFMLLDVRRFLNRARPTETSRQEHIYNVQRKKGTYSKVRYRKFLTWTIIAPYPTWHSFIQCLR